MAKVIVEMEFDVDGFDGLDDVEKFSAIEEVIQTGAESTNSEVKISSITIKDKE